MTSLSTADIRSRPQPDTLTQMSLHRFNQLSQADADALLQACLPVARWADVVAGHRPFAVLEDLFDVAREAAFPFTRPELETALVGCVDADLLAPSLPAPTPAEACMRRHLALGLDQYHHQFGRPFILRTQGRTPQQVLAELWRRLGHDPDTEDRVIAGQRRQIALLTLAHTITHP